MINKIIIQRLGSISTEYAISSVSSVRDIEKNVGKYVVVRNPHVDGKDVIVDIIKNKASITCRVFLLSESSLLKQSVEG